MNADSRQARTNERRAPSTREAGMTLREATDALYAATCAVQDAVNENDRNATFAALSAVRAAMVDTYQAALRVPAESAA